LIQRKAWLVGARPVPLGDYGAGHQLELVEQHDRQDDEADGRGREQDAGHRHARSQALLAGAEDDDDLVGYVARLETLDFDEEPDRAAVERLGFPCEVRGPRVILRIDRTRIADALPALLRGEGVRDVSVEDVPLEEIVAELFRQGRGAVATVAEAEPVR
jgi:hypothetical protein